MSRDHDIALMRLYDDELTDDERRKLEEGLGDHERGVLEELSQLSDVVRDVAERRVADVSVVDDVMAAIEREATEPAPSPRALLLPIPANDGGRRGLMAGALALAAAAAVALGVTQLGAPSKPTAPAETARAPVVVNPRVVQPLAPPAAPAEVVPAAIESIDFGGSRGAIFMVSAGQETTPVVWMTDDPPSAGDRMDPL